MSTRHPDSSLLNLDILALSLLCCLLASVVALVLPQEQVRRDDKELTATAPLPATPALRVAPALNWNRLISTAGTLRSDAEIAGRQGDAIATRLAHSAAERENQALESRVGELAEKVALMQKIQNAEDEARRLKRELEERRRQAETHGLQVQRLVGDYRGPYVLIECTEGAVTVYPGKEKLDIKKAKAQLDRLVAQITAAGFVAFVVKPGGWYLDSYDEIRPRIYEALARIEKNTGKRIGRSTLPLDVSESTTDYLPPGGRT